MKRKPSRYEDILYLPHPVSKTRKRMSQYDRAAQFSPFAALVGYDAAIREEARLTSGRRELAEDALAALDLLRKDRQAGGGPGGAGPEVRAACPAPGGEAPGGSHLVPGG